MLFEVNLRRLVMIAGACLALTACATSPETEPQVISAPSASQDALTFPEMAREVSDGSVQIYGLDGPVPESGFSPATYPQRYADGGVPASGDPNVTIYPFDDGATQPVLNQSPQPIVPAYDRSASGEVRAPLSAPVLRTREPGRQLPEPTATASVYFGHGSTRLGDEGQRVIGFAAQARTPLIVEGHASERAETDDPIEREIVNLKMSMDRAFRVSSDLIRSGVPAEMIETRAYGDTRPAFVPGADPEAVSRRVEIKAPYLRPPPQAGAVTGERITLRPPPVMQEAPAPADQEAPIPPFAPY